MSEANLTPSKIVTELDKHIVGQQEAKRSVAIALRNRFRRMQVPDQGLQEEITPKNILMIGPTGVGKTEIARRLAKLADAPFIKVEATKFTEVGYVGKEVDSIIRDLTEISVKLTREQEHAKVTEQAELAAEDRILQVLVPNSDTNSDNDAKSSEKHITEDIAATREVFRKKLRAKELDDKEIELEIAQSAIGVEIMAPPGMEDMTNQLQNIFQNIGGDRTKLKKLLVKEAKKVLKDEEAAKLVNEEKIKSTAISRVEQSGIVFLDEIDKVTQRSERSGGGEVSREGVQRDLLPLIEGCSVSTKYGIVKTDHILFIASGAFHLAKPSDLIPELQGRLPIRVELQALKVEDFVCILTEPNANLIEQYKALLATEGVSIEFTRNSIDRVAQLAYDTNERTENIGARRLHTLMERLLEEISFDACERKGETFTIDEQYVDKQLLAICKDVDLSKFIL